MYNNKEVFISYKSEDYNEAKWVKNTLEKEGITCWMAPECIRGGSSYAVEIPTAIHNCKVFVLILSERAQTSKWVPKELDQAINEGKIIMPFLLENCPLQKDFEFYLRNVQFYPAYADKFKEIKRMILEIKAVLAVHKEVEDHKLEVEREETENGQSEETKEDISKKKFFEKNLTSVGTKHSSFKTGQKEKIAKTKQRKESGKSKRGFKIVGIVVAAIVLMAIGSALVKEANRITIAGQEIEKDNPYVTFTDVNFTTEDIDVLRDMRFASMKFTNCRFPEKDLSWIDPTNILTLKFENCGLDKEMLGTIDFSKLNKLYELNLADNPDLKELEGVHYLAENLKELNINNTGVSDIQFASNMASLISFRAADNEIVDISPLAQCARLKTLELMGNQIITLESLAGCTELTTVKVDRNQLKNLKGLEQSIYLTHISAADNQLESLAGLENTTLLTYIDFRRNGLTELSILENTAQTLEKVYLGENQLADISILTQSVELKELDIKDNQITTLEPLKNRVSLKKINAEGNQLTDLTGLQNGRQLEYIDLSDNQIENVSAFNGLELQTVYRVFLDLSNNKISQLYVPQGVDYITVHLHGNNITSLEVFKDCKVRDWAFDYSDKIDLASLNGSSYYILNCPLEARVAVNDMLGKNLVKYVTAEEMQAQKDSNEQWP